MGAPSAAIYQYQPRGAETARGIPRILPFGDTAPVVAGSPDPATRPTEGLLIEIGDLRSAEVARSGDRATTREWDETKAESNERKHGVAFAEAMTVFADPLSLTGYDPDHSAGEDRYVTMRLSAEGRILVVAHTDREDRIRIISAREASRHERKDHEDGNFP